MIQVVMRTADNRLRVYLHEDQTAELTDSHGALLSDRLPLYVIGRRLVDAGVSFEDLVED